MNNIWKYQGSKFNNCFFFGKSGESATSYGSKGFFVVHILYVFVTKACLGFELEQEVMDCQK